MTDFVRTRRTRTTPALRAFARETSVQASDFIYPLFIVEGDGVRRPVASMPGQFQLSIDQLEGEINELMSLGVPAVLLFGIPAEKDEIGSGAFADDGVVQRAIRRIRELAPAMLIITDVCACEYTTHGHCGVLVDGYVDNDQTLPLLAKTAISHAGAGADAVAPSDMMDGRVKILREALDRAGFLNTPVISYAAKFASAYYGPFRDAAESAPSFGDRRTHQMDPGNAREAMREVAIDLDEGADAIIVKPALSYMDVIRSTRELTRVPVIAYNVSGEYAMVKAAAQQGWIDEPRLTLETMISFKRAGADRIISYHAKDVARWLREGVIV